MIHLKNYVNAKTDLELIKIYLETLNKKEEILKRTKKEFLESEKELQEDLTKIENKLKELKGIHYSLMYEILVRGVNVTKAVDTVAFKYDLDASTIWKNYYPKVKAEIKNLESI